LSHEIDQAQRDLSKNAIKSVSYFVRTCVKRVCARVLRVLDFFCILLLIAHFSVIGVSSFEFAAADDETQEHSLRVGWRNIFPVVLLCQFFGCGGNSFR
jgi:hypothetical protein